MSISGRWRFLFIIVITASYLFAQSLPAQSDDQLHEAIDLFESGRDDTALTLLNDVVKDQPQCPLAYYYAARIRLNKEQYTRALANLETAIGDSTGFLDAYAYLAITYLEMGKSEPALTAWKQFVDGTGILEGMNLSLLSSIIPPETYRLRLAEQEIARQARFEAEQERERQRQEREERERQVAQAVKDSIITAAAVAATEPSPITSEEILRPETENVLTSSIPISNDEVVQAESMNDSSAGLTIKDTPLSEIEDRINADFRTGVIGFTVFMGVLLLGLGGTYVLVRRRRKTGKDEAQFTEQVERLLDDLKFEVDEDRTVRDFETRRREIAGEIESLKSTITQHNDNPGQTPERAPELDAVSLSNDDRNGSDETLPFSAKAHPGVFRKPPITEEVKTLVSRLYREGKTPDEIAHISDLTKTEVNLILAVRERRLENTIAEIHQEEVHHEHDQLFVAIVNLQAEGASPRDIARQLNLSLSEVELATSIMALRGYSNN